MSGMKMRLMYVIDGRSPIAVNWIDYFLKKQHEVHIVSTFPSKPIPGAASHHNFNVAFSRRASETPGRKCTEKRSPGIISIRTKTLIRQWLGPYTLRPAAGRLAELVKQIQPDLIHAMRIPYEGMVTSLVETSIPKLVSVWGNDFTLHAPATPLMTRFTRITLERADALHTDCKRDIRLAYDWGYLKNKPIIVLPGNGGVRRELFFPPAVFDGLNSLNPPNNNEFGELRASSNYHQSIINPRGFRAYVRSDIFFQSIPLVIKHKPHVKFYCPGMEYQSLAHKWVKEFNISNNVRLLPVQDRSQIAELFRRCRVFVSPSMHDGTPNTLLEAMASGSLPAAGDIESIREWITPGINGLVFDPTDPQDMANSILTAIENDNFYERAKEINTGLIEKKADYPKIMAAAERYYNKILNN